VKPWKTLGQAPPSEAYPVVLQERDGDYVIRIDGRELMTSRQYGSEKGMARVALTGLTARRPQVLIGGLGLGYTLRAALDLLPSDAKVVIAEVSPSIVQWNRGVLADLANRPLEDPRVSVEVVDIARILASSPGRFHAILLDVDNGPTDLCRKANRGLYTTAGLTAFRKALVPKGILVIWSASGERGFVAQLRLAGFEASERQEPAREGGPRRATLFLARAT
jgi:spermidine synthase